jgi:ABC-type sugar transport system ATPase subunit
VEVDGGHLLEVRQVSKSYGAIKALDDLSFDLRSGEIHALLGHNGAGKSTLVKVICGLVEPGSGSFRVEGQDVDIQSAQDAKALGIALVDQELSLVPVLSVEENLQLGNLSFLRSSSATRRRMRSTLDRLGLADLRLSRPVSSLSIGERQLVEIARALTRDVRILVLDEPTATLSDVEIERVFSVIRDVSAEGCGVVFVSHRLGEVMELCQRATIIRDGRRLATEELQDLTRNRLVELMVGELPAARPRTSDSEASRPSEPTIDVGALSVPGLVDDFTLRVNPGEVVGIAGQIGSGASQVLRALAGLVPDARGAVSIDGRPLRAGSPTRAKAAGITFVSNDRKGEGLFLSHSIEQNLTATRLGSISHLGLIVRGRSREIADRLMDLIGIGHDRRRRPVGFLSGGNQQKVFIGRCLERPNSHLLILDEPTRGVDVAGRAEIHDLVRGAAESGQAVIFSSTELDEMLDLADLIVTMFAGRMVSVLAQAEATASAILADTTHGGDAGKAVVA